MRTRASSRDRRAGGFALIFVMVIITVLAILAGSFAYSMKVETRLAGNANNESEMEWLGRSGVNFARFVVANTGNQGGQSAVALNQFWACGRPSPQETNGPLDGLSLTNNELGGGTFSVQIRDIERRLNINALANLPPPIAGDLLDRALTLIGVDGGEIPTIRDSVLDWMDPDDAPRLNGAESDFYRTSDPPYGAKNGPMDDLAELLMVNGVTPGIYWGLSAASHQDQLLKPAATAGDTQVEPFYMVGLVDLFTTFGANQVNLNTASAQVYQLLLGIDESLAENIIQVRRGPDGVEGTEDDVVFTNPQMVMAMVPGMNQRGPIPPNVGLMSGQSTMWEVTVEARIGSYVKQYTAILRREGQQVHVLQFSWK